MSPHPQPDTLAQLRAGQLAGATRLDLSCALTELPREVFDLADTLEVLNLTGNHLRELPHDLGRLRKLRVLFASNNAFTQVPEALGDCPALRMVGFKSNHIEHLSAAALPKALRWLILTDNRLDALPAALGECLALEKLMLAGNRLQALPDRLQQCQHLALLRIAANGFYTLPGWLPQLPRLAWLAYAGNPVSQAQEQAMQAASQAHAIAWSSLQIQQLLGEGASGLIHAATWHAAASGTTPHDVAVKLFKGHMTSDGLPACEMAACLHAGEHQNLIGVHGAIDQHPEGRAGLVMSRMADGCTPLAGPPSLESCSRDVYAPGFAIDAASSLATAQSMASVLSHLHARGLLHGDFYGHNILCSPDRKPVLSDFGAASALPADVDQAKALQKLDVLAYGHLLQELADGVSADAHSESAETQATLRQWQARCTQTDAAVRPTMAEVAQALAALG